MDVKVEALRRAIAKLKKQADTLAVAESDGLLDEDALLSGEEEEAPEGQLVVGEDETGEEELMDEEGGMSAEEIAEYLKPKKAVPKKEGLMVAIMQASPKPKMKAPESKLVKRMKR